LIEELISSSGLLEQQPIVDPHLSRILVTELLFGKGYLKPENARPIRTILNLETNLRDALKKTDCHVDDVQGRSPDSYFFLFTILQFST